MVLKTVEARRYQDVQANQQIRVDHNSNLSLVTAAGDDAMNVEFGFTTSYGALGVVKIEGAITLQEGGAGEAAAKWQETRNLPPEMAQMVHGAILTTCLPEAVGLAKTIRLPPPIPLPQVRMQGAGGAGAAAGGSQPPDAAGNPEFG